MGKKRANLPDIINLKGEKEMFGNIELRNGYYGKPHFNTDGTESWFENFGKEISLDKILNNIETGEILFALSFEYLGETKRVTFERGKISDKNSIIELTAQGADIQPGKINAAINSILLQENSTRPKINIYNCVGWKHLNKELVFRSDTLIGEHKGKYMGETKLTTMGTFDGWKALVLDEVIGRPSLEVILLASMSAIVNGLISHVTTNENPIIHICAPSGTGKSTAGFLAASVFGEPFEGLRSTVNKNGQHVRVRSVFDTWASTANAVITDKAGNRGVAIILNELGKYTGRDMTSVIYCLSEGTDKKRLNEKLKTNISEGFATAIISIGESSILDRCQTKAKGLDIRVLEIDKSLTETADHSHRLKAGARKHNGWAVKMITQYIIDNGGEKYVFDTYSAVLKEECEKAPADKHRYIEKFTALFLTTAKIASHALGITFSIEEIRSLCDEFWESKIPEEGSVSKSFEEIIEHFKVNVKNFYTDSAPGYVPNQVWGRIVSRNVTKGNMCMGAEYAVYPNILKELLIAKGYSNPKTEIDIWKSKGVLIHDDKHNTKKYKVIPNGRNERAVVLQEWVPIVKTTSDTELKDLLKEETEHDDVNPTRGC